MSSVYKQLLINNIPVSNNQIMPKDISILIKDFLFYDKIQSTQHKRAELLIANLKYNKSTIYMPWYYDNVLDIFVANSVMIFIKILCIYNINKFDVEICVTFCERCGNYMECENMDIHEIPLHIKCTC